MASAGPLCEYYGWRSIFYFNALFSAFLLLLWYLIFEDTSAEHTRLSEDELLHVMSFKSLLLKRVSVGCSHCGIRKLHWIITSCRILCSNSEESAEHAELSSPLQNSALTVPIKAVNLTDMQSSQFNAVSFFIQFVFKIASG
uniref:Major facilitator superfamily (MFS) profile domain-containing protein n=1 Tax=Pristionchus pacificus TaxID=54126 RepID=A0A8R1YK97_PRIPA